jgi:pimeloyl-ACP methyl ester carboxylesterase
MISQLSRRLLKLDAGLSIAGEGPLKIAAEICWPTGPAIAEPAMALVCLPGGSINRHYYDLQADGDTSFSFAAAMAAQGMITISIDHLGIGDSSRPSDGFILTPDVIAEANANATDQITAGLQAGTLIPELTALPALATIGVGHSMGGMLTVLQQARARQHAALALLGFSNRGLIDHLPEPLHRFIGHPELISGEISAVARQFYPDPYYIMPPSPEGSRIFYGAKADRAGVDALKRARDVQLAIGGLQSMIPGGTSPAVEQIDVPLFLGLGDADIAGPPHEIPASFPNSNDVSLFILPDTGHCHFIFASRRALFERMADWAVLVATK